MKDNRVVSILRGAGKNAASLSSQFVDVTRQGMRYVGPSPEDGEEAAWGVESSLYVGVITEADLIKREKMTAEARETARKAFEDNVLYAGYER